MGRERVPSALPQLGGHVFKYDFSLPLPVFYQLVAAVRAKVGRLPGVVAVTGFGHMGDMNLHLNVVAAAKGAAAAPSLASILLSSDQGTVCGSAASSAGILAGSTHS